MKKKKQLYSIAFILFLFLFSLTASVATAQTASPGKTCAYITNALDNTVSVIDTSTNTVITQVSVGGSPEGVAVTPDGTKIYVANFDSNTTSVIDTTTNTVTATVPVGNIPLTLRQFIGGPVTVINSTTATVAENKEIKDYLPNYADGVVLHIENAVGRDILVVWTKADSKNSVFKVNIPIGQTRTVTTPLGYFDEYVRVEGSWYCLIPMSNDGHTQLESGYEYTDKYYWGSDGNGLKPIPDSQAPEI